MTSAELLNYANRRRIRAQRLSLRALTLALTGERERALRIQHRAERAHAAANKAIRTLLPASA